jgi:hypothetical protein
LSFQEISTAHVTKICSQDFSIVDRLLTMVHKDSLTIREDVREPAQLS